MVTVFYNLKHAPRPGRAYISRSGKWRGPGVMGAKRILLVEDEPEISEFLTTALRGSGYAVDAAGTAAEAWAYLDAQRYALVITDWRAPGRDGVEGGHESGGLGA